MFSRKFHSCAQLMLATLLMGFVAASPARAQQAAVKLPNVVILATGGTIAGSGADSTTTVGYTSATVGVERLIAAVPELKKVANVKGEQVFQIASESMGNSHWLALAKRINVLLASNDVDGVVMPSGATALAPRLRHQSSSALRKAIRPSIRSGAIIWPIIPIGPSPIMSIIPPAMPGMAAGACGTAAGAEACACDG